ncbi:conserved hypothetical protein [Trichinella spiralis]|uniref:hypothetical protein n=1 Tax=Trichinella spiralis TaxID=6334 RepID=UPI0001EFF010|nr:conserved hypothetical protein [Trichinella spiralis]
MMSEETYFYPNTQRKEFQKTEVDRSSSCTSEVVYYVSFSMRWYYRYVMKIGENRHHLHHYHWLHSHAWHDAWTTGVQEQLEALESSFGSGLGQDYRASRPSIRPGVATATSGTWRTATDTTWSSFD